MNGPAFLAYAEQVLAPTLKRGDTAIMDNLFAHRSRACGPSSPPKALTCACYRPIARFNPIETAFSKLKPLLRKAAARTTPDFWVMIADALPQFTPTECADYFIAYGYDRNERGLLWR